MRQMTLTGPNVTLIPSSSQNTPPHTAFTASATYSVTKGVSQPAAGGDYQTCGTGTWTVSGANSYTGGTTLNAGQITLGNNAGLGAGGLTPVSFALSGPAWPPPAF